MKLMVFVRALYCVDSGIERSAARRLGTGDVRRQRRARGAAAPSTRRCSTPQASPITVLRWYPPNVELDADPTNGSSTADYASLATIGDLTDALDRLQRVYGSSRRLPISTPSSATSRARRTQPGSRIAWRVLYVAGDGGVLHELGRVRQLAQPATEIVRAVPDLRPRAAAELERLGRLRERAAHLERRPEGGRRGLATAGVPADRVGAARAVARGRGCVCMAQFATLDKRGYAEGSDSV